MKKLIYPTIILMFVCAKLIGQEKIKYFEGESIYSDSSFVYSIECLLSFKQNNSIEAIITHKLKQFTPNQKLINEARNNSEDNFLKNRPDSAIAKFLINYYKRESPKKYYCIGNFDASKNKISLQEVKSFEKGGIPITNGAYYNFQYFNNKLIDLDTACSTCYSVIRLTEVKNANLNLKEDLKNKIESDLSLAKAKLINEERQKSLEARRISYIKKATVGDLLIYTQDWERTESYLLGFYKKNTAYKMIIKCYIERIEGEKFQVRIADVSSNSSENFSTPDINGIKINKGDIIWIKPFKDKNWFWGEDD